MPGQGKYGTTDLDKTRDYGLGSANAVVLGKLFKGSFAATTTYADIVAIAKTYLTPAIQNGDPMLFPGGVSLTFAGAPDISAGSIKTGGGGLPSTSWTPPLNSPGAGEFDPSKLDPMDPSTLPKPSGGAVIGIGGLENPTTDAAQISAGTELGKGLTLGKHPGK